jgi:simple sugar transport system substrate-binding protein
MILVLALTACGGGGDKGDKTKDGYTIAVVVKDMSDPWFLRLEEGVAQFAKESGFNCYVKGPPKTDSAQQIQVMEELIAQDINALCVVPIDPEACEPVLKRAREQGIVVISHEAPGMVNVDFNIEAFDNRAYGAYMMDELAKVLGGKGEYVTMVAFLSSVSHNEWMDAAIAHQKTAYPGMVLEPEQKIECEDNMELAYEKTKEMIKKYPNIKGFLGASSYDPPGAGKAIDELGKTGQIYAVGTSVPSVAAPYLGSGSNPAVLCWDPALSGKAMCKLAVMILDGQKDQITAGLNLGLEGYESIKADGNMLSGNAWLVITKDNMDQYQF